MPRSPEQRKARNEDTAAGGTRFSAAEALDAAFIVWLSLVDFDALWSGALQQDPLVQIWRDTGLFDESLNPRPALDTWMNQLSLPLE